MKRRLTDRGRAILDHLYGGTGTVWLASVSPQGAAPADALLVTEQEAQELERARLATITLRGQLGPGAQGRDMWRKTTGR